MRDRQELERAEQLGEFDAASVESIVEYSYGLIGRTLNEVLPRNTVMANQRNRGDLGSLVQSLYFGLENDSKSEPDFSDAGLELKTTGVVRARDGLFSAKERLVLMMIDFEEIASEEWESSALLRKCRLILLLAYLYEKELSVLDRRFVLEPLLLNLQSEEFVALKKDWALIRQKVIEGKAHEISEGDTFVLGACRKGPGGPKEPLRKQPFSPIGAKARAFSLRQPFVTSLLRQLQQSPSRSRPAAQSKHPKDLDIDRRSPDKQRASTGNSRDDRQASSKIPLIPDPREVPRLAFGAYIGKSVLEIGQAFGLIKEHRNQKGHHRQLVERMLVEGGSSRTDLENLGIEMKTIRLNPQGKPREAMSFLRFRFSEIVDKEWEQSSFFDALESKFLFVVFKEFHDGTERLERAFYWNMPYEDRLEARRVWEETKVRVAASSAEFPKASESPVAHVRPKAKNKADTDTLPNGTLTTKRCFWLNRDYISLAIASSEE